MYKSDLVDQTYWLQTEEVASWQNIHISGLTSDIRVYWIWYWMKKGRVEVTNQLNDIDPLGLSLKIAIPNQMSISIMSVIKPLLDGVVSALHYHKHTDVSEIVHRLSTKMDVSIHELERLLIMKSQAVLGAVNLIQPYRSFVKWNPADDRLVFVDITIEDSTDDNWYLSGALFKVDRNA